MINQFLSIGRSISAPIKQLMDHPLLNIGTLLITVLASLILLWMSFFQLSQESRSTFYSLETGFLWVFLLEAILRYTSQPAYRSRIYPWIDLLSILPLLSFFFPGILPGEAAPGSILIRSFRFLKFLYYYRYMKIRSSTGFPGMEDRSPIKIRIFSGTASFLFAIIILAGYLFSMMHARNLEIEKASRIQRISRYLKQHGPVDTVTAFPSSVLKVKKTGVEENYEITNKDPQIVKELYRYGIDYTQLDNIIPGVSLQISFADLNTRQNFLELGVLFLALIMVSGLIFSLGFQLDRLVLHPVDRARRVIRLRISGEDLQASFDHSTYRTEIVDLIDEFDFMYRELTARAEQEPETHTHPGSKELTDSGEKNPDETFA